MKKLKIFFALSFTILLLSGCGSIVPETKVQEGNIENIPIPKVQNKEVNLNNIPIEKTMETENKKVSDTVVLHTTAGDITIKLNADATPKTVENFLTLAEKDFYNETIFHRVLKGFMIQGGCPDGTGMGGPGYKFDDESFEGEYDRGTVAMANAGPNTNGSQFFIMHADVPLPKNYVIFGKVESGMDVVDAIAEAEVKMGLSGEPSTPVEPVTLSSVEIL